MLFALGLTEEDLKKPQIGITPVWFESNPCNSHLVRGHTDLFLLSFQRGAMVIDDDDVENSLSSRKRRKKDARLRVCLVSCLAP
jgi:hypothetical protein